MIPVTGSGFGLGEDSASLGIGGAVGVGGKRILPVGGGLSFSASGGRAVLMPRGRTYHTLYGIPRPREVQQAIVMIMMQGQVPEKPTVRPLPVGVISSSGSFALAEFRRFARQSTRTSSQCQTPSSSNTRENLLRASCMVESPSAVYGALRLCGTFTLNTTISLSRPRSVQVKTTC